MNTPRTSHRASAVAFAAIAASLAALPDASAQFQAPTDVKARIPNVLLLLDTSGSMAWSLEGGPANCKDEIAPTKARYTILGEVLTGTVDDLDCWYNADPLNLGERYVTLMSNSSRHQTGGQNCVPTLNLQSGILNSLRDYPVGWPYDEADKDDDGAVTYCGARSRTNFQKCFDASRYVERDKCFKATIGWSQKLDGVLDTYSQKIRFGLMSFDSQTLSVPLTSLYRNAPPSYWIWEMFNGSAWPTLDPNCGNNTKGAHCMYYYYGWWILNKPEYSYWHGGGIDATSTWLTTTRSATHFPSTVTVGDGKMLREWDIGAQNAWALPHKGRLMGFGLPDATVAETVDHNDMVQDSILGLSLNLDHNTPLAALLRDAYEFIHNDTTTDAVLFPHPMGTPPKTGKASPKTDPYFSAANRCRETVVMLITDGEPTMDINDRMSFWANKLAVEDDVSTIVLGIGLQSATWRNGSANETKFCSKLTSADYSAASTGTVMCTREGNGWKYADNAAYLASGVTPSNIRACCNLLETAILGDPTNKFGQVPYFPDDQAQLKQTLDGILKAIAGTTLSRTVPVFANITSSFNPGNAPASYYELRSAMIPSAKPTSGSLERVRYACNSSSEPVRQSVDPVKGDKFHENLDAVTLSRPRKIIMPIPKRTTAGFRPRGTIRPASVVYDELMGVNTSTMGDFVRMNGTAPDLDPSGGFAGDSASIPDSIATTVNAITTSGNVKLEELLNITSLSSVECNAQVGTTTPSTCADRVMRWYTGSPTTYPMPVGIAYPSRDPSVCGGYDKCGPLGAIYRSNPVIVPPPEPNSAEQSFSNNRPSGAASFYEQYKTRPTMLYAQSIDGMLHAFVMSSNASGTDRFATGVGSSVGTGAVPLADQLQNNELWSLIPPAILPQIWPSFRSEARLLDGPVTVGNVIFSRSASETQEGNAGASGFRTVLVGSSGYGESGFYYAVDVTDPLSPRFLWQLLDHSNGTFLFGKVLPGAAVTTLKIRDPKDNLIKQVGVALLPGGRTPGTFPLTKQRRIRGSDRSPIFTWGGPGGSYAPRETIRDWGVKNWGRSLTVVELETGRIIARLAGDWSDNPGETTAITCTGTTSGANASTCGLSPSVLVNPTRVSFDAPITGTPVAFPSGTGQVATRAYVGDADGTLWRIDLTDPDPLDWTAEIAFDAYNFSATPNNTLKTAYAVNGVNAGFALNRSSTAAEAALLGQPIEQAPTISVDGNNVPVVTFGTGDQDAFNAVAPGMLNMLVTFLDVPNAAGTAFQPTVDNTRGMSMAFVEGGRVTGPLTLFDGKLFFSYFAPGTASACSTGQSGWCAVDYAAGSNGQPLALIDLNGIAGTERCTLFQNGEVVFGLAVNAVPSCVQTEDNFNDQFLAGQYNSYSSSKGLTYQLVMQTSQGGTAEDNSNVNTTRFNLAPPRSKTRLQSWVSVMQ